MTIMPDQQTQAVTGAFGYSGQYITHRLLDQGQQVITLTNSPNRVNPFGDAVEIHPFDFDQPHKLVETLRGVAVLYNTYWIRFNHKHFTQADAVRNTITMFNAANEAGVERIVHVSITNPSEDSHLEYFRGKAKLESALKETGISHAILRPTVLFGKEDILINNIAWMLRHLPIIGVFGDGKYRLQPIHVDDLAKLAVEQGELRENVTIDAIGPETFTYLELVQEIGRIIGRKRLMVPVPPTLGYFASKMLGLLVKDVIITRAEIDGLMADLLYVESPPAGETKLTEWISKHSETLGRKYTSELKRRVDRKRSYESN